MQVAVVVFSKFREKNFTLNAKDTLLHLILVATTWVSSIIVVLNSKETMV